MLTPRTTDSQWELSQVFWLIGKIGQISCEVFFFSEKTTKFGKSSLYFWLQYKSKVKISQNFVAFSEYTYELYQRHKCHPWKLIHDFCQTNEYFDQRTSQSSSLHWRSVLSISQRISFANLLTYPVQILILCCKGQLISMHMSFWCHRLDQNINKKFDKFLLEFY